MTCFLFRPNHQDTSLSPQHRQLPGRGREGRQKNSWAHKFALRQPSSTRSSHKHEHLLRLGWDSSEGKSEEQRSGGCDCSTLTFFRDLCWFIFCKPPAMEQTSMGQDSIVILTLLRDSELPVTGHMIHPTPRWAESLLVAALESLVYNSGASQKARARVLHFLRTGSPVPAQRWGMGAHISSSQGKHPPLTLMKTFLFPMLELNFSHRILFWGFGLPVFLFTNSDPM